MDLGTFERLVRRLAATIPDEYLDGVGAIDVSPRTVPHPVSPDVFTLGECIPVHGEGETIASRIVLYHGSFRALAAVRQDLDWHDEAWETLTHEIRHHLEWRANADALEDYDWAADQNFARMEGRWFDPLFYRSGEEIADGVWKVEDDVFIERIPKRHADAVAFTWHGREYVVDLEGDRRRPLFVVVEGLTEGPVGELVVVARKKGSVLDLFRKSEPTEIRRPMNPADT